MKGAAAEAAGAAWSATIVSAALVGQLVAGKATRDALFLTHFGISYLPVAMIAAAALSAISVIAIARAIARVGPARVVPVSFAASALLFLAEWTLSLKSEHATAIAVYAHTAIFGAALGSAFWSLVNERFDPHQAKKLVGRITSGGTIGGTLGGLLVWGASSQLSVPMMLALLAAMNVVGLWGSLRLAPRSRRTKDTSTEAPGGLQILKETPYLRDLAYLVLAGAITQALLDWLLSAEATRELAEGPRLLGFFALFNVVAGGLSFLAQTALVRWALTTRGLGGSVRLPPAAVMLGIGLAVAASSVGARIGFYTVLGVRLVESVGRSSLFRSAYELFYTPLPREQKRATKTLIDVGVDRLGTVAGSGVLFAVALIHDPLLRTRAVLAGVFLTCLVAWRLSTRLQDGYVAALAASLESGAVDLADDEALDMTTRRTLAETTALIDRDKLLARIEQFHSNQVALRPSQPPALAEPDPPPPSRSDSAGAIARDTILVRAAVLRGDDDRAVRRVLAEPVGPELAPFVIPLLSREAMVRDAIRALRQAAPRITGALIDHLLDGEVDPMVRRRIPRILKVCRTDRVATGLLLALGDPVFEVRVQAGIALARVASDPSVKLDKEVLFDVVHRELAVGRQSWTATPTDPHELPIADEHSRGPEANDETRRGLAHVFSLLGTVLESAPLGIAYRAIRADDPVLRGTAREYLEAVLPPRLREAILPLLGKHTAPAAPVSRGSRELAEELLRSRA